MSKFNEGDFFFWFSSSSLKSCFLLVVGVFTFSKSNAVPYFPLNLFWSASIAIYLVGLLFFCQPKALRIWWVWWLDVKSTNLVCFLFLCFLFQTRKQISY